MLRARAALAQALWWVCAACALVLAAGALLVALEANAGNALVDAVLRGADLLDMGVFSRDDGVMKFRGAGAAVKNALVNWGLAAVVWLALGRLLDRLVRP